VVRWGISLTSLILVAAVANLNLSVANVALPSIGTAFNASQSGLNLVAVAYSLGLATSVLWLGALGDRYGRKLLLLLGTALAIPFSLLAALAPSIGVLVAARFLGGLAAGMAYPTTLALITALWSGPTRTRSIALWSGFGGAIAALGPVVSGLLLEHFAWGSVFLFTLPLAVVALVLAWRSVPAHVNETTDPVDNLGGILSAVLVGALILAINFAPVPNAGALAVGLAIVALAAGLAFFLRQRRASPPLYDLHVAARRTFWVAAGAGIIVFGSLMGAIFIGQQFLQNVLGYSTLQAGVANLPQVACMILVAPLSATLVETHGARYTLLVGFVFCLLGFLTMLLLWKEHSAYWEVGLGYALIGIGVGLAGTPASHSLTGSVPVKRAGMASGTADLQRDLGGAIMQSIFGALLTAGYAAAISLAIASAPSADQQLLTSNVQSELTKSFAGAVSIAQQYPPQYANAITAAAKTAFLAGDQWAYLAGVIAVLLGTGLVFFLFPKHDDEQRLLAMYHAQDTQQLPPGSQPEPQRAATASGAAHAAPHGTTRATTLTPPVPPPSAAETGQRERALAQGRAALAAAFSQAFPQQVDDYHTQLHSTMDRALHMSGALDLLRAAASLLEVPSQPQESEYLETDFTTWTWEVRPVAAVTPGGRRSSITWTGQEEERHTTHFRGYALEIPGTPPVAICLGYLINRVAVFAVHSQEELNRIVSSEPVSDLFQCDPPVIRFPASFMYMPFYEVEVLQRGNTPSRFPDPRYPSARLLHVEHDEHVITGPNVLATPPILVTVDLTAGTSPLLSVADLPESLRELQQAFTPTTLAAIQEHLSVQLAAVLPRIRLSRHRGALPPSR
jgi:MFS family permease